MTKPLLLVDVDGVLCPFGATYTHSFDGQAPEDEGALALLRNAEYPGYTFNEDYYIHVSEANKDRLAKLAESFDLVWCTGWMEKANEVISPLHDLPDLPVVDVWSWSMDIHWKFDGIKEFVGDRPYAFIDDDISETAVRYGEQRNKFIPTLWLPIKCYRGLTDAHVDKLVEFAKDERLLDTEEAAC